MTDDAGDGRASRAGPGRGRRPRGCRRGATPAIATDPPTHLHYLSRATLARLLARHGFQVREVRAVPVVRSVRQTLYAILALRRDRPALYRRLERLVPPTLGFPLNTFDIMQIIAEYAPAP